jgi:translation initiation factor 2B subunit (eIF-2B alpha/beta/delta family)
MRADLERRIRMIASDAQSGATRLARDACEVLREARAEGRETLRQAARALCRAQPSMASIWTAACAALADETGDALTRFEREAVRAPGAIARFFVDQIQVGRPGRPVHVTTFSASATVATAVETLGRSLSVTVACAEGRPRLEGRNLAARLAAAGLAVEFFTDAGLATALGRTDAVALGADAVSGEWVLNKVGSLGLAAAAAAAGVPVYVLAARNKMLPPDLAAALTVAFGPATEVWDEPPSRVAPANPYFEAVPLELVAAVISDLGVLTGPAIGAACVARLYPEAVKILVK